MKTAFNNYDVVKLASGSSILTDTNNIHAKDYIGIVREASDNCSYIEWFDCKSKTATREVTNLEGWIGNDHLSLVGSLYHLITSKANAVVKMVTPKASANTDTTVEVRVKRKYTRKPGAAKPGPKPKADKTVKAVKPVKEKKLSKAELKKQELANGNTSIPLPIGKWQRVMDHDWLTSGRRHCFATGKFKHFSTRDIIDKSIVDSGAKIQKRIDYGLDFVIVGEKPGPNKIEKLRWMAIPMISEEQWLAMIGAPGFGFDSTNKIDAIKNPTPLQEAEFTD